MAAHSAFAAPAEARTYVVVKPGTHPGIVFSEQELPALRERAKGSSPAAEAYGKLREAALADAAGRLTAKEAVGREGRQLSRQLEAMALVYQVERDEQIGRKGIAAQIGRASCRERV